MMRAVRITSHKVAEVAAGLALLIGLAGTAVAQTAVPKKQAILVYSLIKAGTATEYSSSTASGATSPTGSMVLTSTMLTKSYMIIERRPATSADANSYQRMAYVHYYTVEDSRGVRKFYEVDSGKRYRFLRSDEMNFSSVLNGSAPALEYAFFQELPDDPITPSIMGWSISRTAVASGETTDTVNGAADLFSLQGVASSTLTLNKLPLYQVAFAPAILAGRWQESESSISKTSAIWPPTDRLFAGQVRVAGLGVVPAYASTNQISVSKATFTRSSGGSQKATLDAALTSLANPAAAGSSGPDLIPDTDDDLPTGTVDGAVSIVVDRLESIGYNPLPE